MSEPLHPVLARLSAKAAEWRASRTMSAAFCESVEHALRIEFTHGSTAIEGNTLTLRETQLLIDEGIAPAGSKPLREIHETVNHHRAVLALQEQVGLGRDPTEAGVCDLHRLIMANIDDDRSGRYRTERVMVVAAPIQPLHPARIPEAMAELMTWIGESRDHALLTAAAAHYRFVKIHPFYDGNGRTGRLLLNWLLLRSGYPLTPILAADRTRYLTSLDDADRGEPLAHYSFLAECVERSLDLHLGVDTPATGAGPD